MPLALPRYWACTEGAIPPAPGRDAPLRVRVWGWSTSDQADAERHAAERLTRARERAARADDEYGYERAPPREPILDEIRREDGSVLAAITRNRHGVRVLNVERVMFVDIDLPQTEALAGLWQGLARLFWRPGNPNSPLNDRGELSRGEREAIERVEAALGRRREWSVRVYRTYAGLRLLATHALYAPDDVLAQDFMREVGADPWYVKLCRAQRCFRARLSAKPRRLFNGVYPAAPDWFDQLEHRRWVEKYELAAKDTAACLTLKTLGSRIMHPEAATIVDLHDRATRAGSTLSLA